MRTEQPQLLQNEEAYKNSEKGSRDSNWDTSPDGVIATPTCSVPTDKIVCYKHTPHDGANEQNILVSNFTSDKDN
jgi:hypothetical protein